MMYNAGQEELRDCTVQVVLTGKSGDKRKNVHFIETWPANSWVYARYETGQEILDRPNAGSMTVSLIQNATVSIWSPNYSTELLYEYQGAEKDKDITEDCKDLKLLGRYQPYDAGVLWSTQPAAKFTLDGIDAILNCRIDVTFRRGAKSKTLYWEHDYWLRDDEKSFQVSNDDLGFEPAFIDAVLTFPRSQYRYETTWPIEN